MKAVNSAINLPRHGGNLKYAIEQYGGTYKDWIDLSTGISPWVYPIPEITDGIWRELPPPVTALEHVAASYYLTQADRICVTPGSQLAIRILPTLIQHQRVAIPLIGYQEHRYAWDNAKHSVFIYQDIEELKNLITSGKVDSAVLINPNNPSNELVSKEEVLEMASLLKGLLIVDEAFADFRSNSVASNNQYNNLIVIRSIGKFFGLAGARIGFLIGQHSIINQLKTLFTPWSVNAPAQFIAQTALADTIWQNKQSARITQQASELEAFLLSFIQGNSLDLECRSNGLFTSLFGPDLSIKLLHQFLADNQIWARIGDTFTITRELNREPQNWLRLSLPGDHFNRLQRTLNTFTLNIYDKPL
jgi:cobalamin biosynthetic protein CobC